MSRRCQRRDNRFQKTGKFDNTILDQNSIFNISRSVNPKNKSSMVSKVEFTAEEFKTHFCKLQEEGFQRERDNKKNGEVKPDHIKVSKDDMFKFENYPVVWDGKEKHCSIKMCLAASKLKTRGLKTILNKKFGKIQECSDGVVEFQIVLC